MRSCRPQIAIRRIDASCAGGRSPPGRPRRWSATRLGRAVRHHQRRAHQRNPDRAESQRGKVAVAGRADGQGENPDQNRQPQTEPVNIRVPAETARPARARQPARSKPGNAARRAPKAARRHGPAARESRTGHCASARHVCDSVTSCKVGAANRACPSGRVALWDGRAQGGHVRSGHCFARPPAVACPLAVHCGRVGSGHRGGRRDHPADRIRTFDHRMEAGHRARCHRSARPSGRPNLQAYQQIPQYTEVNGPAGMTLAEYKFIYFWEWVHRLIARVIGWPSLCRWLGSGCAG